MKELVILLSIKGQSFNDRPLTINSFSKKGHKWAEFLIMVFVHNDAIITYRSKVSSFISYRLDLGHPNLTGKQLFAI